MQPGPFVAAKAEDRLQGQDARQPPVVDDRETGLVMAVKMRFDEFGDRPGVMADGEECVRVNSGDMAKAANRGGITAELWSKHTVSTRALGA